MLVFGDFDTTTTRKKKEIEKKTPQHCFVKTKKSRADCLYGIIRYYSGNPRENGVLTFNKIDSAFTSLETLHNFVRE